MNLNIDYIITGICIGLILYNIYLSYNKKSKKQTCLRFDDIIPDNVYSKLDFDYCVIGGSYALKMFEDAKWKTDEIDIFVAIESGQKGWSTFKRFVNKFIEQTKSTIDLDYSTTRELKDSGIVVAPDIHQSEIFYESIAGTVTLNVPGVSHRMRFFRFNPPEDNFSRWRYDLLNIMDAPTCVVYDKRNAYTSWSVSDAYYFAQDLGIDKFISPKRWAKYKERGYK